MTIDGSAVESDQKLAVTNPADGQEFAWAPRCSAATLAAAVEAARRSFPLWSALSLDERAELLHACGRAVSAHQEQLAELLTLEQGKPLADARAEVALAAEWFADTAALSLPGEVLIDDDTSAASMRRVPIGVVAAIAPFNFPIILSVCKIAPALLAGNTVVVKPAPATPLSTLRMVQLLAEILPAGVLNAISGDGALGAALVESPGVDLISFTGSIPVGLRIARSAGSRLRRVVLELGGNDPAIVLPDTDISRVAPELFARSLINSGQFCAAVKRIYVSRPQEEELVDALAELAVRARVGDGRDPVTQYGPLIDTAQAHRVAGLVHTASAAGARVVSRSACPEGPGAYHAVTVVSDLPQGTELELTEQFGPVIPVLAYDDLAGAVSAANGTEFGLGASVWGDQSLASETAGRISAGTVWLNTHGELRHAVPFGGVRHSGIGVEYGYHGLVEYTRIAVRHEARRCFGKA
ncbi:aldehyde dehydrogenase family protein [Amycolatopsis sp. NBC_00345]|uniref:aldehyde dehydrogenase family protein n=1 Tax=Amycolatopsis sp. NBC_00345 TaxID=2975955 RepID=UPI002E25AC8A